MSAKLHVGHTSSPRPFFIHELILRLIPPILTKALKLAWLKDSTIHLTECNRDAFDTYAQSLYNSRIGIADPLDELMGTASDADERDRKRMDSLGNMLHSL
jgi:hypothetical protein